MIWRIRGGSLALDAPLVMGIVNLTPDSFSDGGLLGDLEAALDRGRAMVSAGAAILDVGGESTRPGAAPVSEDEERARILPFVRRAAAELGVPLSVDTRKAAVARAALDEGASVVNDVSGLVFDPAMAEVVADGGAGAVLMHMRGVPATMAGLATYGSVASEVAAELGSAVARARRAGISDEAVVLDPGLGFAKTSAQSLALLSNLAPIHALGFPVLVGPSRKSFLGAVLGVQPERRATGTAAACVVAYLGGARIFRVHDVEPVAQALAVARAILEAGEVRERR
ncbi:MAG TPA: dihydropteroate synthase [Longimicrobiales bacterium]|nr:dihydropteroate synthase [Longimicrobiales bacterium]